MCECVVDGFSHPDKCPIDFSESGHLSFKEQVLAPSLVFGRGPTTISILRNWVRKFTLFISVKCGLLCLLI